MRRQHQHNAAHERRHGNQPAVITSHKKSGYMRYDKTDKCDASHERYTGSRKQQHHKHTEKPDRADIYAQASGAIFSQCQR